MQVHSDVAERTPEHPGERRQRTASAGQRASGPAGIPATIRGLQRTVGNRAVTSMLGRPEVARYRLSVAIRRPVLDAMPGAEKTVERSDVERLRSEPPAPSEPAAPASAEPRTGPMPPPIRLPDIRIPALAELAVTDDPVSPTFQYASTIARGGVVVPPGAAGMTAAGDLRLENISVIPWVEYLVTATVAHRIRWDVLAGAGPQGQTNIAGYRDAAITDANYKRVVSDLTPNMQDLNGRPPRTQFWSRALTERHEQFHATDAQSRAPAAVRVASAWLGRQQAGDVQAVQALLNAVPGRIAEALVADYVPQMEQRAYGDGAPAYTALANEIFFEGLALNYP